MPPESYILFGGIFIERNSDMINALKLESLEFSVNQYY